MAVERLLTENRSKQALLLFVQLRVDGKRLGGLAAYTPFSRRSSKDPLPRRFSKPMRSECAKYSCVDLFRRESSSPH
jgi:hypothetical protein